MGQKLPEIGQNLLSAFDFDVEFSPGRDCFNNVGKKRDLLAGVFFRLETMTTMRLSFVR